MENQEQIGKVMLDYTYYPGEDLYSDGPVEEELLKVARDYPEDELNSVIARTKSWPILYHFSHIRQNIVEWLPIAPSDRVLEIGSGCGAMTGALAEKAGSVTCIELSRMRSTINAYRNRHHDNIKIMVGNFRDIEKNLEEKYDIITLIGVFEYSAGYIGTDKPYEEMIRRIARHLSPDGRIVIAIENRLGLKYWAGCTEDHVGALFEGLENYPKTRSIHTFSRKELSDEIERAGDFDIQYYYPYPDYKFPMTIYSDEYLPAKGELKANFSNFDRPRVQLFEEPRAYDGILEAGLYPEFANSFQVILSLKGSRKSEETIIYSKYSNERHQTFDIRTDIIQKKDGSRLVRKTSLYPKGKTHIEGLKRHSTELSKAYEGIGLKTNRVIAADECSADLEYIKGQTLEEYLDDIFKSGAPDAAEKVENILSQYLDAVKTVHSDQAFTMTDDFRQVFGDAVGRALKDTSALITDIDLLPSNIILDSDPASPGAAPKKSATVIDYEWTFDFPIPCKFILYRIIHYYLDTNILRIAISPYTIYEKYGITSDLLPIFASMEESFQAYIEGSHVPMRDLYPDMTPGVERPALLTGDSLVVYFSDGAPFHEGNTAICPMTDGALDARIPLPDGTKEIRIDPGDEACAVELIALEIDGSPIPHKSLQIDRGHVTDGWAYIGRKDPNICGITVPDGAKELHVHIRILKGEENLVAHMERRQKQLMNDLVRTREELKQIKSGKYYKMRQKLSGVGKKKL